MKIRKIAIRTINRRTEGVSSDGHDPSLVRRGVMALIAICKLNEQSFVQLTIHPLSRSVRLFCVLPISGVLVPVS
jgi:hypothetical protein